MMKKVNEQEVLSLAYKNEIARAKNLELEEMFIVANGAGARCGKSKNQYIYIVGELNQPECIVGVGLTPMGALADFCESFKKGDE